MEVNKIPLQSLYKKIILEFSIRTGKDLEKSMNYFYTSQMYELISKKIILRAILKNFKAFEKSYPKSKAYDFFASAANLLFMFGNYNIHCIYLFFMEIKHRMLQ
jgi:hypothetical protein